MSNERKQYRYCVWCGKAFIGSATYCSIECKQKRHGCYFDPKKKVYPKDHLSKTMKKLHEAGLNYAEVQKAETLKSIPKIDIEEIKRSMKHDH